MNKLNRLHNNDRVEVIDKESQYFGYTGTVMEVGLQPLQMIGYNSKTIKSTIIPYAVIKLDKIETPEKFTKEQVRKIS